MKEVKVYLTKDGRLVVKGRDGVVKFVDVYNGGGYYSALDIKSQKEIDEAKKAREESDKKFFESMKSTVPAKKKRWFSR